MIGRIETMDGILEFTRTFDMDTVFSDPMLSNREQFHLHLVKAIAHQDTYCVIGCFQDEILIGLFSFLVEPQEFYIEMLVGLSREKKAYEEMLQYLRKKYPKYHTDFVYNPKNYLLQSLLQAEKATFEPVQCKLVLGRAIPAQTVYTIVPYEEKYRDGYLAIHDDTERYWTGEKVLHADDRFHVYLALIGTMVIGYIDVTYGFDENEPYDLFVCRKYRRLGYGRALLAKAISENKSSKMVLLVDEGDTAAMQLYLTSGFTLDPKGASITAHLKL